MRAAPPPAPAALLSRCPTSLASAPRLLLPCPRAPATCRAAPAPGVARSVSVSDEAPEAAAEPASALASTTPRRRLILLRHGESTAGSLSTREIHRSASSPLSPSGIPSSSRRRGRPAWRPPMPLLCGAPPWSTRAPSAGLYGGSSPARCCLQLRQACFQWSADGNNGGTHSYKMKNARWRPVFALETGGSPGPDGQDFEDTGFLGRTRLGRLIQAAARELLKKLNSARNKAPTKIFLVLLGFYTANALATILGQTGDWDVLVAAIVVAAIEGIGMLMYRKPVARPSGRFHSLISMINFWKAGVCLGLFVDAFKLGS